VTCRAWALLLGALLVWAAPVAAQQDATWSTNPFSGDYGDTANWSPAGPPGGTAFFGTSTISSLSSINPVFLHGWTFNAGASNYSFTINADFEFSGAGIVVNGGSVAITNLGGLWFYNTSTAGNATITNQLFLQFFNTSTAGSSTITNNGFLYFFDSGTAGNATITNNNIVRFSGTTTAGSSTITNNNFLSFLNNSTAGNAAITNGDFGTVDFSASTGPNNDGKLSAGSIAGVGKFYLGADQLTVGGNNRSTVVDGIISDCGNGADCLNSGATGGSLVKTGTGTLTLAATNSYTGATIVNAGTLNVTGDITSSSGVTVNSGGTLAGTGKVGTVQTNSGGTFAPGSGTAGTSMAVTGALTFQSAAIYMVQINPATASFANVTGNAALGGATVNATFAAGSYVAKQYTILTATGIVSATFNPTVVVTNLPSGFKTGLSYDTHDAFLNLALSFVPPPGSGLNGNQQNVGNAIINFFNRTGSIPLVFGALTPAGLSQISGETTTGSQQTTFDAMTQFMGAMTDPFTAGRIDGSGSNTSPFANEIDTANAYAAKDPARSQSERDAYAAIYRKVPVMAAPFVPSWSVWAAGFGGSQTTNGNATVGSNSSTSRLGGVAVGADYRFSPNTIAGFALAGGGTSFSVNGFGTGRSDLFQAGAFVRHTVGPASFTAALAYGWQDITTDRTVTIAGIDQLRARFNANAFSGRIEDGYRFATAWMGVTPYAAAQFTTFDLPAYAEQAIVGANTFALAYGAKSATDPRSEIGVRTDKSWAMPVSIFTLRGRFAWAHDYNDGRSIGATFQTLPGASFVVNGAAQTPDKALTTASAEVKWRSGVSLAATFEGEFSGNSSSYAGKGVARYQW
jgi:autotransporter-associated beta strand protein